MREVYANYIIQKTKKDYDAIAEHFDLSRVRTLRCNVRAWEGIRDFLQYVEPDNMVLDFGCGNGRLSEMLKEKHVRYVGLDQSCALIMRAEKLYPSEKFLCVDGLPLPFSDVYFDTIFSIATLHHIPSLKKRKEVIVELTRTLKPDGRMVLTVWNLWQRKYIGLIFKHTIHKVIGQFFPSFREDAKLDFGDIFIPWKDQDRRITALRYYHCFYKREFENLVRMSGLIIEKSGYFGGRDAKANIYLVVKK